MFAWSLAHLLQWLSWGRVVEEGVCPKFHVVLTTGTMQHSPLYLQIYFSIWGCIIGKMLLKTNLWSIEAYILGERRQIIGNFEQVIQEWLVLLKLDKDNKDDNKGIILFHRYSMQTSAIMWHLIRFSERSVGLKW